MPKPATKPARNKKALFDDDWYTIIDYNSYHLNNLLKKLLSLSSLLDFYPSDYFFLPENFEEDSLFGSCFYFDVWDYVFLWFYCKR